MSKFISYCRKHLKLAKLLADERKKMKAMTDEQI